MISTITLIDTGNSVKAVIQTKYPVHRASLSLNDVIFNDEFNEDEPYDLKAHVFHIPKEIFREGSEAVFSYRTLLGRNYSQTSPKRSCCPGALLSNRKNCLPVQTVVSLFKNRRKNSFFPG